MKRIDSSALELGMYVAQLDRPWLDSPFLFQGFPIKTQQELDELKQLCNFVYIDEEKQAFAGNHPTAARTSPVSATTDNRKIKQPHPVKVEDEITAARKIRDQAKQRFSTILESARLGKGVDVGVGNKIVGDIVESLLRNPDALLLLRNISQYDSDAESHAINTSILCLTFGRFLGLPTNELKELGLAALLHDIGETELPVDIVRNGPKNAKETELYNRHTELGAKILREGGAIPQRVIDVALSHHEQADGGGYPRGLEGDEIDLFARIVAIVNVYDHVTLGSSGPSLPPAEALRYLYLYRDKFFDAELTERFIQCLGVYPVGSLVELATGEVAIVISIPPDSHLYPRLLLVRDGRKRPYTPPHIMNLAKFASSEHAEKYAIKRVLPNDAYDINLKGYIQDETGFSNVSDRAPASH